MSSRLSSPVKCYNIIQGFNTHILTNLSVPKSGRGGGGGGDTQTRNLCTFGKEPI